MKANRNSDEGVVQAELGDKLDPEGLGGKAAGGGAVAGSGGWEVLAGWDSTDNRTVCGAGAVGD